MDMDADTYYANHSFVQSRAPSTLTFSLQLLTHVTLQSYTLYCALAHINTVV